MKKPKRLTEDDERRLDLDFIRELRTADLEHLQMIALNLSFGGPEWQREAVRRALKSRGLERSRTSEPDASRGPAGSSSPRRARELG